MNSEQIIQLFIALLWAFGIVLLIGLGLVVFLLGRKSIVDKPDKGLVFIQTGLHVSNPKKAKLQVVNNKGSMFKYGKKIVMVPKQYSELYYQNCRMIFVKHLGQLIASPFDKDVKLSDDESETLIYELSASNVGADGMRALKGNRTTNVILIGIATFIIGAILSYGITQYMSMMQAEQIAQQQPKTEQKVIEVE